MGIPFRHLGLAVLFPALALAADYSPRGIGGGGALAGLSFSPYAKLWFVGTDMGTLFRSTDEGKSWTAVSQKEAAFDSHLADSSGVGFSADPKVVFFAEGGGKPKRSLDGGVTWKPIPLALGKDEKIRYWQGDSANPKLMLAATSAGLQRSTDQGATWSAVAGIAGEGAGTFVARHDKQSWIYHATRDAIFLSKDGGATFASWYAPAGTHIRGFAGGADAKATTLAFIDTDGANACAWAKRARGADAKQKEATFADCGYLWTSHGEAPAFKKSEQYAGHFVRMAENDPKTIYATGGNWVRQYGSKVWVSHDAGQSWTLTFHLYDWDKSPYAPWPADKLEYSAPGLEIGWDDNAYESFAVNPRDARTVGGTGEYFLHVSRDGGSHWNAPFTRYADTGPRAKGKRWSSNGLEVTSVLRFKFHPANPKLGYASLSDMAGLVTEDGGETFRVSKAQYNTNYDYAFDPAKPDRVYAASGEAHDWPEQWFGNVLVGQGGIYRSDDRGRSWARLTPTAGPFARQFLSVAYDPSRGILYGGPQGAGVAVSKDGGQSWEYRNAGLPETYPMIVPQLETDPRSGDVYALVTGDAPDFHNAGSAGIYFLDVKNGAPAWKTLRGAVKRPSDVDPKYGLWDYPTAFAVDWSRPARDILWLVNLESHGQWLATGAWKTTDRGASWARMTQFTHPTAVTIDPKDGRRVYLGGLFQVDGQWGKGGALYTHDGGLTWKKNASIPLLANLRSVTLDPGHADQLFYTFFGGGMLPRPPSLSGFRVRSDTPGKPWISAAPWAF